MLTIHNDLNIWQYIIPFAFIILDIVTGLVAAWGNYQSAKMREGLKHKAGFIGALLLATLIDLGQPLLDLGFQVPTVGFVAVYLCLTEVLSIFENLCELNDSLANSRLAAILLGSNKMPEIEDGNYYES